jgi:hypothetical protein
MPKKYFYFTSSIIDLSSFGCICGVGVEMGNVGFIVAMVTVLWDV